jgi:hypothetical protein
LSFSFAIAGLLSVVRSFFLLKGRNFNPVIFLESGKRYIEIVWNEEK